MPAILLGGLRGERPVPVVSGNQRKGSPFRVGWVWKVKSDSPTAFYRKWEMGSNLFWQVRSRRQTESMKWVWPMAGEVDP